jgi:hypothetical protein
MCWIEAQIHVIGDNWTLANYSPFLKIIDIEKMLKNTLENLGTHWDYFFKPCEHHGNFLGMWWEHFKNTKIQKKKKKI